MKRSKIVLVSLTTVSLSLTGCRRSSGPASGDLGILPPEQLSDALRKSLPTYEAGENVSGEQPPLNAYDPLLGYYHSSCSEWHPYPYDYYDSRWGYFRCGKWSRYDSGRQHYHSSSGLTYIGGGRGGLFRAGAEAVGAVLSGNGNNGVSGSFRNPASPNTPPPMPPQMPPPMPDYDAQPANAPRQVGVAHSQATASRISRGSYSSGSGGSLSRGGFGSTGHAASSSSYSSAS
jgi:hypothetical protein